MFQSKKIKSPNSIGQILEYARYKTGLSLKLVTKHININKKYLEALEKDEWHKLPGEIYAKNFLKKYCQFLKLDPDQVKIDFDKIPHFNNKYHSHEFRKKTRKWYFLNPPKILRITLVIIVIILVLFYISKQIQQIIRPPEIILTYPAQDLTTFHNSITISGKAEPEVKIKINQEEVVLDENNNFEQKIDLLSGLNLIKIEGRKKYSKTTIIERKVIFEQ